MNGAKLSLRKFFVGLLVALLCGCSSSKAPPAAAAVTQALPKGMVGVWQFSSAYVEAAAQASPNLSRMPGESVARQNARVSGMRLEVTLDGRLRMLQPSVSATEEPKLVEMTFTVTRLRDGAATLKVLAPGQGAETMTLVREGEGLQILRAGQPADQRDILVRATVQKITPPKRF